MKKPAFLLNLSSGSVRTVEEESDVQASERESVGAWEAGSGGFLPALSCLILTQDTVYTFRDPFTWPLGQRVHGLHSGGFEMTGIAGGDSVPVK